MKVLHVDAGRGWRGGQRQALLAAAGMARRGHQVLVACQRGGALAQRAGQAGLEVRPLSFRGDLGPAAVAGLWRLWRRERPQVAHLHDSHALAAAVLARALGGGPALVASRRVAFPLRGPWSRWKFRGARRVIAVSRAVHDALVAAGLDAARLRVVHDGVPDRPPAGDGGSALRALGVPDGSLVVGSVAALTGEKDHVSLLRAARLVVDRVPQACFVIAGEGGARPELEALGRDLGLGGRCLFLGFRDDLDRLLPAFSVFCLSSQAEGLGTSLLDAMAFSRPVVATRVGGVPEVVEEGLTGRLVPARDPAAMAAALSELLADPGQRERMGRAGRRRYEERFTDERMVEATLAVYREVA